MRARFWLVAVLPVFGLFSPAAAHVGDQFNSVHFHSGEPDFGRVPRRARVRTPDDREVNGAMDEVDRVGIELGEDEGYGQSRDQNRARLVWRADRALARLDLARARELYREALRRYGQDATLLDRLEVIGRLASLARVGSGLRDALSRYVRAAVAVEGPNSPLVDRRGAILSRMADDPRAGFLQEHAAYQWGCLANDRERPRRAVEIFQRQVTRFPHSTKTEAGLIMLARCALLAPDAKNRQVSVGLVALDRLAKEFPRTRFRRAAAGLRARVLYLTGEYARALKIYFSLDDMYSVEWVRKKMGTAATPDLLPRLMAGYLRDLTAARNYDEYAAALHDIDRIREKFTTSDAQLFGKVLREDDSLPAPYLYYRLYHTELNKRDMLQLGMLARRIAFARSRSKLPALVMVRIGEVDYFRKDYRRAARWAQQALDADQGRTDATPRGLYVRGASLEKLGRPREALSCFEKLVNRYPKTPLMRGAREELAILYEAVGELGKALDQYFALGYQADVAFFLDGRMSLADVERYRETRVNRRSRDVAFHSSWFRDQTSIPETTNTRDVVTYALGVRCLRAGKYDRAVSLLRTLPRSVYRRFSKGRAEWSDGHASPDPIAAAHELAKLQGKIARARSSSMRAAAMYRLASYIYGHGTLLFYSPPLWQSSREIHLQFYWNKRHATRRDRLELARYLHEHEIYARSMRIYEEIARRYPRSPYAPKALYRAACAAFRQSGFNGWWREHDKEFGFQVRASQIMATLARRYPKHKLAPEAAKFAKVFRSEPEY